MAFVKKTWTDRDVEQPKGRTITHIATGETEHVLVDYDEGDVYAEGDRINAANFNDLENRIETGFESIPSESEIDDSVVSASKTWSSQKINGLLILDVTNVGV